MESGSRDIRQDWINSLESRGLSQITSVLLEAFKPLSYISAQLVYTGMPLLKLMIPERQIMAAGSLLEDPGEYHHFVEALQTKELK